jgi:hypothetical protein
VQPDHDSLWSYRPWFSGVVFVFDLPTGQIATFFNRLPLTAKFGEFLFHALG